MLDKKRTVRQWVAHLEMPDEPLTLQEFIALSLLHIRENTRQSREATEHVEGMLGALDLFAYNVAQRSGIDYAASAEVRAALDRQRIEDRRKLRSGEQNNDTVEHAES